MIDDRQQLTAAIAQETGILFDQIQSRLESVLQGKREAIRLALCAILGGGHLLIEDLPGMGKTTLAQALARVLGLDFSRIQFTSDLLPSDVIGAQVFDQRTADFSFRPGPIFARVILADEINRAPPRTQSALLEAMSEGQVSVDGVTHALPKPFAVLATQNPLEQSGTYPLPDSQLDRFLVRISLGYPGALVERALLLSQGTTKPPLGRLEPLIDAPRLSALQRQAQSVRIEASVADYVVRIVHATRETKLLTVGVSTRGLLAIESAAKAHALIDGRDFLLPDDVKKVAVATLAHRIQIASGEGSTLVSRAEEERIIQALLDRVEIPE